MSYLNDPKNRKKAFPLSAREIAPHGSKKDKYQWREALRAGDKVDFNFKFRWIEAEVVEVLENEMVHLNLDGTEEPTTEKIPKYNGRIQPHGSMALF